MTIIYLESDVGYLGVRFVYFQDRFVCKADQGWTKIELDELYPIDYLFSSQDTLTLKYCQTLKVSENPFLIRSGRGRPERTNDGPRRSNHDPENRKSRNS